MDIPDRLELSEKTGDSGAFFFIIICTTRVRFLCRPVLTNEKLLSSRISVMGWV